MNAVYTRLTSTRSVNFHSGVKSPADKRKAEWLHWLTYQRQLPIIDKFMILWLTNETQARTLILTQAQVEKQFRTAFALLQVSLIRDRVLVAALHNDVHAVTGLSLKQVALAMNEVFHDPDALDPPKARAIARLCLFANQLSGDLLPEAYSCAMFIAFALGDKDELHQLLADYPTLFAHWRDEDGEPAIEQFTYKHLLMLTMLGK